VDGADIRKELKRRGYKVVTLAELLKEGKEVKTKKRD